MYQFDIILYSLKYAHRPIQLLSLAQLCVFACQTTLYADQCQETVTLQLKWFHQFQFAGYNATVGIGFYAQKGLNVILKERDPSKSIVQAVIDDSAEYGVVDVSLLLQRMKGQPIVLLKQIFQHSPLVFLSPKESSIISPHAMVGKKVMFDPTEDARLVVLLLDTIEGLDKIELVPHSYNIENFMSGKLVFVC